MKKIIDILTAVDTCVDILLDCGSERPKFGQAEQFINDYNMTLGGSCGIFASGIAKLGLHTVVLGAVGDDIFGSFVKVELEKNGVDTSFLRTENGIKTGIGFSLCLNNSDRSILTYNGSIDSAVSEDFSDEILQKTRHLHIGSYYLMHQLRGAYPDILKKARTYGVPISLDTNWDPSEVWDGGIMEVLPYVDIFFPNENEAMFIAKRDCVEEAMDVLTKIVPVVALKQGNRGASLYVDGKVFTAEALDVTVQDTVGAGDSFDAGFVYAYLNGMPMEECLKIGCICGSCNTKYPGGTKGQPTETQLKSLMEETGMR